MRSTAFQGLRYAGRAEWTKLRTDAANQWLLLAVVALTAGVGAAVAATARCDAVGCGADATRLALTGVLVGQVIVAVLAVLAVGNEYGTGMIRTTLAAVPHRPTVLLAKAAVLTAVTLLTGTLGVLAALLVAGPLQPGRGFTPAHGYAALSLTDPATLRAAAGTVLYLALIALLGLGTALLVRDSATAIGIVLGLLFLFPLLAQVLPDPAWQRLLQQIAPMPAGLSVQSTVHLDALPIGPWQGLGVLALWSAGALAGGGARLWRRDG
ncbi:ABC transporter permease [Streptomyces sp. NPDC051561]|uniref:ABC transporter permease n=1 Tax=Streptomyces sp. NPDC051561 TaxID=3365658 RepID=UPI0037A67E33